MGLLLSIRSQLMSVNGTLHGLTSDHLQQYGKIEHGNKG